MPFPCSSSRPKLPTGVKVNSFPKAGTNADPEKNGKTFRFDGGKKSTADSPVVFEGTFEVKPKEIQVTQGYVALYIHGDLSLEGCSIVNQTKPEAPIRLTIYMLDPGSQLDIGGTAQVWAHIYAPLSDVRDHGTSDFTGWIIGKTLQWKGNSTLHYDGTDNVKLDPYKITLVK